MIRYSLECPKDHVFDHWFDNMGDAESKLASGALSCPTCGDSAIRKSLMAPAIGTVGSTPPLPSCAGPSCRAGGCPALD